MTVVLQGRNLHQLLERNQALPAEMVIPVAIHLASALDAAHKQGKIFRGIFPDQILFGENGQVQILELAAPRIADDLTLSYLSFISPEQIEGKPPTIQSDIYSLGVVLYAFLFGRVPFMNPKREEVIEQILQSKLVTFPKFPVGLSQLDWIIRKCLLRVVHRRFLTVEEVTFELRKVARPARKFQGAPTSPTAGPPAAALWQKKVQSVLKFLIQNWKIAVGAFGVLLILVIALIVFSGNGPKIHEVKKWRIQPILSSVEMERDASFSPAGDSIVYVSNITANWELYKKGLKTDKSTQLTQSPGTEENPRWSPLGDLILYTYRGPGRPPTLFAISFSGGIPQKLAENAIDGQWSPDGVWICYVSPASGNSRSLYIMDFKNVEPRLVLKDVPGLAHPSFSPDGKEIVCESDVEQNHGLILVNVRSGKTKTLTKDGHDFFPSWNWKTDEIYFSRYDTSWHIWRTDRHGSVQQVTNESTGNDFHPVPSIDSSDLIFTREYVSMDLFSVNPENGTSKLESPIVSHSAFPRSVSTGKSIVYLESKQNGYNLHWLSKQGHASSTILEGLSAFPFLSVSSDGSLLYLENAPGSPQGLTEITLSQGRSVFLGNSLVVPYEMSPDHKSLFYARKAGDQVQYSVKQIKTGTQEAAFELPFANRILRAAWVDRGRSILYLTQDHNLHLWDTKTKQASHTLQNCYDFSIKMNGDTLAALHGQNIESTELIAMDWKTKKRKILARFSPEAYPRNIDWARDGKLIFHDRFKKGSDLYLAE